MLQPNLIEVQADLELLPDEALQKEGQQPSGLAPAFMVHQEIARRVRTRQDAQGDQAMQAQGQAPPPVSEQNIQEFAQMLSGIGSLPNGMGAPQGGPPQGGPPQGGPPVMASGGGIIGFQGGSASPVVYGGGASGWSPTLTGQSLGWAQMELEELLANRPAGVQTGGSEAERRELLREQDAWQAKVTELTDVMRSEDQPEVEGVWDPSMFGRTMTSPLRGIFGSSPDEAGRLSQPWASMFSQTPEEAEEYLDPMTSMLEEKYGTAATDLGIDEETMAQLDSLGLARESTDRQVPVVPPPAAGGSHPLTPEQLASPPHTPAPQAPPAPPAPTEDPMVEQYKRLLSVFNQNFPQYDPEARAAEAEKQRKFDGWLALAQAGGTMASSDRDFLGAMGEGLTAGGASLGASRQSGLEARRQNLAMEQASGNQGIRLLGDVLEFNRPLSGTLKNEQGLTATQFFRQYDEMKAVDPDWMALDREEQIRLRDEAWRLSLSGMRVGDEGGGSPTISLDRAGGRGR